MIKCKRCNETFKCMVEMTEHDRLNHPQESVEKPVKSEKNKGIPKVVYAGKMTDIVSDLTDSTC